VTEGKPASSASRPDNCLFCRIVAREIPAEVVAEDEHALAFRDIEPQAPTHVLVIPKEHHPTLADLAVAEPAAAIATIVMARGVAEAEGVAGYRLVANNGAAAQQTVFHAHLHVLGGRDLTWPPG
jgi:histidine triad (HIT) family protein